MLAEKVAEAAWEAVHGSRIHTLVGPTARKLALAAKWAPAYMRKRAQGLADVILSFHTERRDLEKRLPVLRERMGQNAGLGIAWTSS